MANRIIKDSIWSSQNFNDLSVYAERHFYRILMLADDYGCFESTPAVVRGICYPLQESIRRTDVEKWQQELRDKNIIATWNDDGREYSVFVSFDKHNSKYAVTEDGKPTRNRRKTPEPPNDLICQSLPVQASSSQTGAKLLNTNPNTNHNPNTNQKDAPVGAAETFVLPEWINPDKWDAFMEVRKKKKAAQTDYAKKLIINELTRLRAAGDDPNQVLEKSIINSWKDVYPLKDKNGGTYGRVPVNQSSHITARTQGHSDKDYLESLKNDWV